MKILFEALAKFFLGLVLVSSLIFISAGKIYWQGAMLVLVLFVPMLLAGLIVVVKSPERLKRRLDNKEKEKEQKSVVALSGVMFIGGFVAAGLSCRLGFLMMPSWVSYCGAIIFVSSYIKYGVVLKQNEYLFRTIRVEEGQRVVDNGFYKHIRHPMYAATVFMFLSIPLILGSFISLLAFLPYPLIIAKRIKNEEEVLEKELPGYTEYKKKVKYKLIPFIW